MIKTKKIKRFHHCAVCMHFHAALIFILREERERERKRAHEEREIK
jgi:hypothetical protein